MIMRQVYKCSEEMVELYLRSLLQRRAAPPDGMQLFFVMHTVPFCISSLNANCLFDQRDYFFRYIRIIGSAVE